LSRDDGERPDGLTLLPWANGRCMLWDSHIQGLPDTFATSDLNRSVLFAGAAANEVERRKVVKYRSLSAVYSSVPGGVESLGALGKKTSDFFLNIGHRITSVTTVHDTAAEYRCATWHRHVCVGDCSGFNRTGPNVLYIGSNCCYLFLCVVYINLVGR